MYSPPCCGELLAQQDGEAPGADGEEGEGEAGEHTAQLQVQPGGHLQFCMHKFACFRNIKHLENWQLH